MPNWATGTLKIRGTREDIFKFCEERMGERAAGAGHVEYELDVINSDNDHGDLYATVHGDPSLCIWLKDSRRNFVDMDTEVPYYWDVDREDSKYTTRFGFYKTSEKDYCVIFPFMAAWGVDEDYYAELSKKYPLIFKIYTVEQGMGFFSEFEAKDGEISILASGPSLGPKDKKFDDSYGRFVWECPFPFLGG